MREILWLVKNGIDFDLACALDDAERTAWCIIFGEQEGGKFNWESFAFEEPQTK